MTEKRFKLEVEDDMYYTIFDNQSIDEEDKLYGLDDEQVCDLLNELAEENEQLKSFIQELAEQGCGKIVLANGNVYKASAVLHDWNGGKE